MTLVTVVAMGIASIAQGAEYKAGEVLVKFKNDVRRDHTTMQATYAMLGGVFLFLFYLFTPPPLVFNPVHEKTVRASARGLVRASA